MSSMNALIERLILDLLAEYIGAKPQPLSRTHKSRQESDLVVEIDSRIFVIEYKTRGDVAAVSAAVRQARRFAANFPPQRRKERVVPVVVVPSMGNSGRALCDREGISWIDLNGNARIREKGLNILVDGQHKSHGQGRAQKFNPFAPKASRIPRVLLLEPKRVWTQSDLVDETQLDKGLVSNVIRQLERDDLVQKDDQPSHWRLTKPGLLLDAWRERYDFSKHAIEYGTVAARSGTALLTRMAKMLEERGGRFAATGLAAASMLAPFADFRVVTLYLDRPLLAEEKKEISFREGRSGSNLWLALPNDSGVYAGGERPRGVPTVSPVQCYLDLAAHPERAADAARELREAKLSLT